MAGGRDGAGRKFDCGSHPAGARSRTACFCNGGEAMGGVNEAESNENESYYKTSGENKSDEDSSDEEEEGAGEGGKPQSVDNIML